MARTRARRSPKGGSPARSPRRTRVLTKRPISPSVSRRVRSGDRRCRPAGPPGRCSRPRRAGSAAKRVMNRVVPCRRARALEAGREVRRQLEVEAPAAAPCARPGAAGRRADRAPRKLRPAAPASGRSRPPAPRRRASSAARRRSRRTGPAARGAAREGRKRRRRRGRRPRAPAPPPTSRRRRCDGG